MYRNEKEIFERKIDLDIPDSIALSAVVGVTLISKSVDVLITCANEKNTLA